MKVSHIKAIIYRHMCLLPISLDRLTDLFFWPLMDILILGLTTTWITTFGNNQSALLASVITGAFFWRVVWQSSYEIGVNILEETWNKNLTNLLTSPLTKLEWLIGNILVGFLKLFLVLNVMGLFIYLVYGVDMKGLSWQMLPYFISLILFGWFLGFVASSLVLLFGMRAQAFTWTLASLFSPFCAAFYPVSILPNWAQSIAYALPGTYIFESMRSIIMHGHPIPGYFWKSILINIVYIFLSMILCNSMFERARRNGFDHLE